MSEPLWQPTDDQVRRTNMAAFMTRVTEQWSADVPDTDALHRFSITEREKFWQSVIGFAGITAETWGKTVLVDADSMPGARWFPDARLNFAENMLKRRRGGEALVFWGEDKVKRRLTHRQLYDRVSVLAQALAGLGLQPGDRVVGFLPNMPETIAAMLAASSLGAVWSSCSPDFGVSGVLDRFDQIEPKILFAADGYRYNAKRHDCLAKTAEIAAGCPSIEKVVIVPYGDEDVSAETVSQAVPGAVSWDDFTAGFTPGDINFRQLPFEHPLYILFSSGTTGKPKCIVHSQGGALLKHASEQILHCDIHEGDRVFFFTTCGWMMWNWLASVLACQATLLLYDGSPFHPDGNVIFDLADAEAMTLLGTSAKFIDAVRKGGLEPIKTHALSHLRMIASTGSPLAPEAFDFVYAGIKADVHLASIAGGTDILSCFMGGNPTAPVWRGEIQTRALGMAVDVFDDDGKPVRGEKGELVCTAPFPSMPVHFWNDPGDEKYRAAYFERFPGVWCHGDYVELTEHDGLIIYGRSDTTLNPGGVRIGTAEIYRQVEKLEEVIESIVIGQEWDNDVRIVLFVVLKEGLQMTDGVVRKIKDQVRANCTPRHVPAVVVQVADIPRTKSGKITELAVRDIVHGREVKNLDALANPEALDFYRDLAELKA